MASTNTPKLPEIFDLFKKSMAFEGLQPFMQDFLLDQLSHIYLQLENLNKMTSFKFKLIEDESV